LIVDRSLSMCINISWKPPESKQFNKSKLQNHQKWRS
jgi:hypothetical protein